MLCDRPLDLSCIRRRKHCANKIQSLNKVLNFQHGRNKYVKRKIEPETVVDARSVAADSTP